MVDQRFDRVFAAFEAAWKSGKRPGAEAAFKHFPDDQQNDALAKLLTIEIAMRRAAGESLNPSDFQRRFPRNLDLIEAAFAADDPPSPVEPLKVTRDERNLLSAIVAMQNQFIDQAMFTEAIQHCATNKDAELTKILQTEGYITRAQESLLVALVAKHVEGHNENAKESIAALSSLGPVKHAIASIVNPQVRQDIETIIGFESKPIVLDEAQTIPPSNEMATIPPSDETQTLPPSRSGSTGDGYTHTSQSGSRFRIVRPHARGGLGQVSVAIDSELNRDVALKEIQPQYADDKDSRYRFRLEAEVTGRLEHPGIVPVYGLGQYDNGRPFYAMRFIQGDSLKEAIDAFYGAIQKGGLSMEDQSLELRQLVGRLIDVCNAIDYAHSRNVLHRDLKPGNIMLGKYGETLVVDWGLAKVLGEEQQSCGSSMGPVIPTSSADATPTIHGSAVGTPAYMSPEQAAGRINDLGPATDIYSLGATLYYLLTGRPPFVGNDIILMLAQNQMGEFPSPTAVNPQAPFPLESICLKAMALEPAGRYATAKAMVDDLERWLADRPVSVHKDKWIDRAARWCRAKAEVIAITVAFLMLASSLWTSFGMGNAFGNLSTPPAGTALQPGAPVDVAGLSESLANAYTARATFARASGLDGDQDEARANTIRSLIESPTPVKLPDKNNLEVLSK